MFYLIQIEEIFNVHYTERFFLFKTQSSKELVKYVEISFPRMLKNENKENNQIELVNNFPNNIFFNQRKFLQFYYKIHRQCDFSHIEHQILKFNSNSNTINRFFF